MTYCIALRTAHGIFVAADSALSAASPIAFRHPEIKTTSFGERQGKMDRGLWPYVLEEGLKVTVADDFVAAFAGDVGTGENLLEAYRSARSSGFSARQAADVALQSTGPHDRYATVLIGYYTSESPTLIRVDTLPALISEIDGLVQIGSDLPDQHRWTEKMVAGLMTALDRLTPADHHVECIYAQLVCLLQSYGIHDYLLESGVGGSYVGAWITPSGARWQGDHLFVAHSDQPDENNIVMCSVAVRNDALCLTGNQAGMIKVIGKKALHEDVQEADIRLKEASDDAVRSFDLGLFDYFSSININRHVVSVLEMQQSRHHALVSLCPQGSDGTLGILWTESLLEAANLSAYRKKARSEEITLRFIPFIRISAEEEHERDLIANAFESERLREI